jgi:Cysteine-rich CPCC
MKNHGSVLPLRCPCCYCKTLSERDIYEICPVCFWEDDGKDDHNADTVRGGPNGRLSLTQARVNYRAIGASDARRIPHVRPPKPAERPDQRLDTLLHAPPPLLPQRHTRRLLRSYCRDRRCGPAPQRDGVHRRVRFLDLRTRAGRSSARGRWRCGMP